VTRGPFPGILWAMDAAFPPAPPVPPRDVPFRAALGLRRVQALVFLILLPLGLIQGTVFYLLAGGLPPGPDAALDAGAVLSHTGRLLAAPYRSSTSVGRRHPLVLEFAYRLPDGGQAEAYCYTFDRDLARRLAERGEGLAVELDPDRPRRARLEGTRLRLFPSWLLLIPALDLAAALGVGLWWWRSAASVHRLLVHGRAYRARVVELRPMRGVNPPPMVLSWTLEEEAPGVEPSGRTRLPRRHAALAGLAPGSPIWVLAEETGGRSFPYLGE